MLLNDWKSGGKKKHTNCYAQSQKQISTRQKHEEQREGKQKVVNFLLRGAAGKGTGCSSPSAWKRINNLGKSGWEQLLMGGIA